jgi:hypothetical protein
VLENIHEATDNVVNFHQLWFTIYR